MSIREHSQHPKGAGAAVGETNGILRGSNR